MNLLIEFDEMLNWLSSKYIGMGESSGRFEVQGSC